MAAAGFGAAFSTRVVADEAAEGGAKPGAVPENKLIPSSTAPRYPAVFANGKVIQPERPLTVFHEADVLVVGAGPAGFTAAIAAARTGAKTALVERYGYIGGLWTGGMVLLVISTHAKEDGKKVKVVRGIGDELLERLNKIDGGVINQKEGSHNPTVDPEACKFVMDEMIREAGVKMFFHCWGADAVMENGAVRGAVFESKAGRQAILAKVVIDTTGDGDIFAAAGAEHEQRLHAIGLVHRMGNVDRVDKEKLKEAKVKLPGAATPLPSVHWVNLRGPSTNALSVEDMTRMEIEHRKSIWNLVQKIRKTPGGEQVFLLNTAPQLGVRITRMITGTQKLTYKEFKAGTKFPDTIAVGGAQGAQHCGWPIPYGTLLPQKLEGLLTAGRSIDVEEKVIEDMRLIGSCLTTGHAAGVAAAVAVKDNCRPREVQISKVQKLLIEQGAYLG
jgi:ribulose 1,5-bisphosphate synthetase/thiazole synthase